MTASRAAAPRIAGRVFAPLAAAVVLLGLADSLVGAYFVLFLAESARLSPVQVGFLFSLPTIGGIACSIFFGRRFDRRPTRAWVVVAAVSSAIGYGLLTTTMNFAVLLVISIVFFAAYQAAYPQLFSISRHVLGGGPVGQRAAPLLRSGWSLAWAIGPLLGAALVPLVGFTGVLWIVVALLILIVPVIAGVPSLQATRPRTPAPPAGDAAAEAVIENEDGAVEEAERASGEGTASRRLTGIRTSLLMASIVLFFGTMFAGSLALPLLATQDLGQPDGLVGVMYSLCAVVEILVALGLVGLRGRLTARSLLIAGLVALAVHFLLVALAHGPVLLLIAQVPRGLGIAVVGTAGILYFQDAMAPATGLATTLFSSASDAGFVVAGLAGGWAVQLFGPQKTFIGLTVTAILAVVLFLVATSSVRARARN